MTLPIPGVSGERLERLARAVTALRGGKPLAHGSALHRPWAMAEGLEFQEHGPLMPGDDVRRIDWRASARARHPQVRRYRDERAGEWLICLDRSASMGAAEALWPRALQLAAGLAYLILHFDHRVGLALFSERIDAWLPPGRSRHGFLALVERLAGTQPSVAGGATNPVACLPLLDRGRRAILISDGLHPDGLIGALDRLAATSGGVELIHLAAPAQPLPAGTCEIEDAEARTSRIIDASAGARAAADRRLAQLAQNLAQDCLGRQIHYTSVWVGDGPDLGWESDILRHVAGLDVAGA